MEIFFHVTPVPAHPKGCLQCINYVFFFLMFQNTGKYIKTFEKAIYLLISVHRIIYITIKLIHIKIVYIFIMKRD